MSWFESHAYVAAWLALPVAFVVAIIQQIRSKSEHVEWRQMVFLSVFFLTLGIVVSPVFDTKARDFAGMLCFPAFLGFVWRR
jgi:hypothetical protein